MQTSCPNCSNKLVVDDAKVPPTPFMLKCPKCQGMVKVPGRGTQPPAAAPVPAPAPTPAPQAAAPPPSPTPPSPPAAPSGASPSNWSPPAPPVRTAPSTGAKALIALPTADTVAAMTTVLGRLGFAVEPFDAADDKILRLQHGEYALVASARNGVPEDRNLYRIVQSLPLEIRRRLFLLVLGDDLQTAEGTQAFALLADLVVNSKDAASCDRLLAQTLVERKRVYQTFWDAEDRKLEGKL